jgi:hypothetical protein
LACSGKRYRQKNHPDCQSSVGEDSERFVFAGAGGFVGRQRPQVTVCVSQDHGKAREASVGPKCDVLRLRFDLDLGAGSMGEALEESERGVDGTVVLAGIHNPNGLGHGPDAEILLVDAAGGILHIGFLASKTPKPTDTNTKSALILNRSISFPTTIDNPSFYHSTISNQKGYINAGLTAEHTLSRTARDPKGTDPSIIYYLAHASSTPKVLFQDDGGTLRTASAAVLVNDAVKRETWMFATGFLSDEIVSVRTRLQGSHG